MVHWLSMWTMLNTCHFLETSNLVIVELSFMLIYIDINITQSIKLTLCHLQISPKTEIAVRIKQFQNLLIDRLFFKLKFSKVKKNQLK